MELKQIPPLTVVRSKSGEYWRVARGGELYNDIRGYPLLFATKQQAQEYAYRVNKLNRGVKTFQ